MKNLRIALTPYGRVIAVVLLFALVGLVGVYVAVPCCVEITGGTADQEQEAAERAYYKAGCSEADPWPVLIDKDFAPPKGIQHPEQPSKKDCEDLRAQWAMAVSARRLVDLTCYQFWLAVLGTMLLGATLTYTAINARGATDAAKAAGKAANLQQSAFETLERPYLFVRATDTSPLSHRLPMMPPSLFYVIANYGKTPAILRSISIILEDNPPDLLTPSGVSDDRFEVISQDETIAERQVFVEGAPDDKFYRGNDAALLFLRGSIDYEDANGTLYRDFFCLRGMPGARTFRLEGGPELNRRTVVRRADAQ